MGQKTSELGQAAMLPLTPRMKQPSHAPMLALKLLNLALLILFPIAWTAPLARAGLLPFFKLPEISILSGIASLWETDVILAILVALFALVFPILKTLLLAGIHWQLLKPRALPLLAIAGKLAMADVFLIATFIVLAKGVGVGRVETAWGIYLFTACVLMSMLITYLTDRLTKSRDRLSEPT